MSFARLFLTAGLILQTHSAVVAMSYKAAAGLTGVVVGASAVNAYKLLPRVGLGAVDKLLDQSYAHVGRAHLNHPQEVSISLQQSLFLLREAHDILAELRVAERSKECNADDFMARALEVERLERTIKARMSAVAVKK